MKLKALAIASILFLNASSLFAQKINITSNGVMVYGSKVSAEPIAVNSNDEGWVLAYGDGLITGGEKIATIAKKNSENYTLTLKTKTHPEHSKDQKKVAFIKFIDKRDKPGMMTYVVKDGVTMMETALTFIGESKQSASNINAKLIKEGFSAYDDDETLGNGKAKSFDPELGIVGNILYYSANGRGTKGYKTAIVVRWDVYDMSEEKILYRFTSAGYTDNGKPIKEDEAFRLATKDALWGLISDVDFVKLCNDGNSDQDGATGNYTFSSAPKPHYSDYSSMIESSIKSAVTIKTPSGYGSGFIISEDGYLLTNYHVIADSGKYEVTFNNGLKLSATVVSKNKAKDVALLKLGAEGFAPLPVDTTTTALRVGTDVIAIGTPADVKLKQSVTKGIVSGMREFDNQKYVQTDVSINPGNSGGALINKNGAVVGIVTAKLKGSGVEGLGFAIPINEALHALNITLKDSKD
ncbi:S1C family serine protease [Chitinophagaceae bacterium MMS25-I14]